MANLSDASGTIRVTKVGKEFLAFLKKVQGEKSEAYYTLIDRDDLTAEADENGDLTIEFNTFGRWAYSSNIDGYLKGEWLQTDEDKAAYDKFVAAMKKKNGSVAVDYSDSEGDWMGSGIFRMYVEEKEVRYSDTFKSEDITIKSFADMQGETEHWALAYIYGDDAANAYDKYLKENKDKEPVDADAWYEKVYETEE